MSNIEITSPTTHAGLNAWVAECAALVRPETIQWCDGSDGEYDTLVQRMLNDGTLLLLDQEAYPGCYLHRSHPNDVARVEKSTFICSRRKEDAGPTNNWMAPDEAKAILTDLFAGSMQGKTMYVIPYIMGPVGSPLARVGVEITDSPYVVLCMRTMTRMGSVALDQLGTDGTFVPGLHAIGELDPERRYICHFPEERLIWSYGSNYGGNALLGKKCFALRIASVIARDEGWLAEHMLILELSDPTGAKSYFAAAFPSACGKTNLAMLESPLRAQGYTVRTVGDDIAWMHIGADGRLWAINPEAGFFGVAPGTSDHTNRNAMETIRTNTVFTNVAMSDDGKPWWEGMDGDAPCPYEYLTDWKGNRRRVADGGEPFAHGNSRYTTPARQCPSLSEHWEDPQGVPISGIIFGGRRYYEVPLVIEAMDWSHGVLLGATMASRTTAAAIGQQNVLRHDPMAMLPFCGYNMGDYLAHWLTVGEKLTDPPAIFHVNWFRKDTEGRFLWPGFGENVRALIWMLGRIRGEVGAKETVFGYVPRAEDLNLTGLDISADRLAEVLRVTPSEWTDDLEEDIRLFATFGEHMPKQLQEELADLLKRVESVGDASF
ncbi:MAG: phosphoenolpyruvate carboxykinase (GTP) [Capsulimonadales bacterium]|nr:phosphoenolpyruvate carboxykinase (GTP) [Capsulimonadales bacterium]